MVFNGIVELYSDFYIEKFIHIMWHLDENPEAGKTPHQDHTSGFSKQIVIEFHSGVYIIIYVILNRNDKLFCYYIVFLTHMWSGRGL
jgi:hypothetical protein